MNCTSHQHASSGDLLADRRFAWGEAAARESDHAAAADLFAQTLELAPRWAPAWMALGEARARTGDRAGAVAAYASAQALDVTGALGASLRLAALGAVAAPATASPDYVRALFDQYASRFDEHLVTALEYRGPQLLCEALARACLARARNFQFHRGLDLGCGTGLMASALHPRVDSFIGVDLSPQMIKAARASGLYNHLHTQGIDAFLALQADAACDLVIAADVFVYIGDLAPVFAASARVLEAGGLFAFTVQRCAGEDWRLGEDLRYAHSSSYLRGLARAHGFAVVSLEEASTRKDAGVEMPGLVCVLGRRSRLRSAVQGDYL